MATWTHPQYSMLQPLEILARKRVMSFTDELATGCQAEKRDSQEELYRRYHVQIYRLLLRMVGRNDADDVLQEVFLQVFRNLQKFDGRSQLGTWIYRIAVNEALQHLRKRRRVHWLTLEDGQVVQQSNADDGIGNRELLENALQRLDPDLRAVFLLRETEKYSYAQIAELLQIPEGTVASRLNQARRALKEHLVELGWEP